MAFNFEKLQLSQKRFLAKSFDKTLKARSKNSIIQREFEKRQARLRFLEDRKDRLARKDRYMMVKAWRISLEKKTPEPNEWLNRPKSEIWRQQARERISKRGSRPGPIIPAMIFANDGSCHQIFFEKGEIRQKTIRVKDPHKEREELETILPSFLFPGKSQSSQSKSAPLLTSPTLTDSASNGLQRPKSALPQFTAISDSTDTNATSSLGHTVQAIVHGDYDRYSRTSHVTDNPTATIESKVTFQDSSHPSFNRPKTALPKLRQTRSDHSSYNEEITNI